MEAWERAGVETPFHRAAPGEYFQARVAALARMGRSLQEDPLPAPERREEIAGRLRELHGQAIEVRDWVLARVLAESGGTWGALSGADRDGLLARAEEAEESAAREDVARLDQALDRIARAEDPDSKEGSLRPGELPERARRLARTTGPALGPHLLARLDAGPSRSARLFLVELLGRRGDALAESGGVRAPDRIVRGLEGARARTLDETVAWIWAAARLEVASPGAFHDHPAALAVAASARPHRTIAREIASALEHVERSRRGRALPPARRPEEFARQVEELADSVASTVRSGTRFGRAILDRLDRPGLSERQIAFLFDQLGLLGFRTSFAPGEPGPVDVLRRAFLDLPVEWRADRPPDGVDVVAWSRARRLAFAAARNLSRLGDAWIAPRLLGAGIDQEAHAFERETRLALALAPAEAWPTPDAPEEWIDRGLFRWMQGDGAGALEDLTRALELAEDPASALLDRAHLHRGLGDVESALADYGRFLDLHPEAPEGWEARGALRRRIGDPEGALADAERALALAPDSTSALALRGMALEDLGDFEGMFRDLRRAVELDPADHALLINLARCWSLRADPLRGREILDQVLADDPGSPEALVNRAEALQALGERERALADLDRAIELRTGAVEPHVNRGALRGRLGDTTGAIEDFELAVELDASCWVAWGNLGQVLAQVDRLDEAREAFEEAIRRAPPEYHETLRSICRRMLGG